MRSSSWQYRENDKAKEVLKAKPKAGLSLGEIVGSTVVADESRLPGTPGPRVTVIRPARALVRFKAVHETPGGRLAVFWRCWRDLTSHPPLWNPSRAVRLG
jgi:hypothetical protein